MAAVVSTATCAAAAVMAEPVAQLEEEVESIVEKHQLEEMERQPNNVVKHENEVLEDDIEPELQRIKDDEDVIEAEEAAREPDIPVEDIEVEKVEAVEAKPIVEAVAPVQPPAPVVQPPIQVCNS